MTQSQLESIRPDTAGLMASDMSGQVMGVILTLAGGGSSKYHFMSRYFAPWNGIPEDPVTGRKREIKVLKVSFVNCFLILQDLLTQCLLHTGDLYLAKTP